MSFLHPLTPDLLAEVTRGGEVESRHYGHIAVVDTEGKVIHSWGNPEHPTFPRSSLKPLQALAGIARGTADHFDFTDAEIAVTCASHSAEPRHREAVARILAKIEATEDDLYCGPHEVPHVPSRDELIRAGKKPTRIYNNCSGKHSGMLALARVLDAPLAGYWDAEHPVQREIQRVLAATCDVELRRLHWGTDGCGVPTYLLSLRQLALGFARLSVASSEGFDPSHLSDSDAEAACRITTAMIAEPEMVRGEGGFDSVLMRALPGVVAAKGGAEGCQCFGLVGEGLGVAIKVDDGSPRALAALSLAVMRKLGVLPNPVPEALQPLLQPSIPNTRGEVVGEIRVTL
jgi:L-asparaginase II